MKAIAFDVVQGMMSGSNVKIHLKWPFQRNSEIGINKMSTELNKSNDDIYWNKQDIKDHMEWFGSGMAKSRLVQVPVSDLFRGLTETSANPVGNYRTTWIMILRREPGKCKLPRGFGHLSGNALAYC